MKRFLPLVLLTFGVNALVAQLDTIHWFPPMHARAEWGPQYLYLSTPETVAFPVNIRDGSGNLIQTVNISNTQPFTYNIGSTGDTYAFVADADLHKAVKNKGLVVDGTKKFYAYFRTHSSSFNQAGDLTCKGKAALGKSFRIGHLIQGAELSSARRANFVGILATEDSTRVTLSGFDPATDFRKSGVDVPSNGPEVILLQKGESVVVAQYMNPNTTQQPPNGFMGMSVESTQPIVINVGSYTGAPVTTADTDIGIDQIVPVENVGKEYVLCRGNGSTTLERPIIVAHYNGTQVWLNGNTAPTATLNAGEWYAIPTSSYTAENNLHVLASQPIYMYQMIGGTPSGGNEFRTAGLIFVPPISCSIPSTIDNIISPNVVGTMTFDGGVMITAMRDSQVVVTIDGTVANLGAPSNVTGNPDFVTYRNVTLFSQTRPISSISIRAQGAVQVAMYGQNNAASYAAFYSGFSKTIQPNITLKNIGDGVCPDTLVTTGRYDGVQWMYEDSILKYGKDTFLIVYAPGRYIAQGYLGVCRRSETAADTLDVSFVSPAFPYSSKQPSCFGFSDGQILFGKPYGGLPPYQYSIDNGTSFSKNSTYANVKAGVYKLIVRDSLGCYNRPLSITIGQPTQFVAEIIPGEIPDAVNYGQFVALQSRTNRPTISTVWLPSDGANCPNCSTYSIRPTETTIVTLEAKDSAGCLAYDTLRIVVQPNVFAPNVIHPNSSEKANQTFILFSKEDLPILHLAIYDRWGEHIFDAKNISTNVLEQGWDGTFRGRRVEQGVYVFYAEIEFLPGRTVFVKGDVTVLY